MKIIPHTNQKTNAITNEDFFSSGGPIRSFQFTAHLSSIVINRCKNFALLLKNIAKHSIETSIQCRCGTLLAYSFYISKFLVKCDFSTSNTILWIFFTNWTSFQANKINIYHITSTILLLLNRFVIISLLQVHTWNPKNINIIWYLNFKHNW